MSLSRGRVLPRAHAGAPSHVTQTVALEPRRAARLERTQIAADERARAVIESAERRARQLLAEAERGAREAFEAARDAGRAEGLADFAAAAMRLRHREDQADTAALGRTIELSRLLAERLLRRTLDVSPGDVTALATQALEEARGARRICIHASPEGAAILSELTAELDAAGRVHAVVADATLGAGDLRLETDVGTVDARLGTSLAALASRLREALRP